MKKYKHIVSGLFAVLAFLTSQAQQLPPNQANQDPCNPFTLCGAGITTNGSYQGLGNSPNLGSLATGCMPGFYNVVFWHVTIAQTGLFSFTLTPLNACDDYDWAVWLLPPNTPCPQDLSMAGPPVRSDANWIYSSPGGQTGLSPGGSSITCQGPGAGPAFLQSISATAGQEYLVAICNAGTYGCIPTTTPPSPVSISLDSSTATFVDSTYPAFVNLGHNCAMADHIIINLNKPIQCSSIDADGSDFSLNNGGIISSAVGVGCPNPSGLTQSVIVYFTPTLAPNTYILSAQIGHDGNTLLDACDSALKVPDTLQFTIAPTVTLNYQNIDTPACSEIHFSLNLNVACDSIAADGSDFSVTGPQPVHVVAAYGIGCDSNYFTDSIVLILQPPIQTDGTYTIHAQKGTDGNTVLDTCGHRLAVGSSISYTINSYDGKIKSLPDTVICEPGYIHLYSNNNATPPDANVICGLTAPSACPGSSIHFAANGVANDSLSSANSPFYSYGVSRLQFVYTATELMQSGMTPGTIKALAWNVKQLNSGGVPFADFTIKLGCTNVSELDNNFLSNTQIVYSNTSAAGYVSTLGWNTFVLTTPFNWDGKSNLVVEICDNDVLSQGAADVIENSVTPYLSTYHLYSYTSPSGCSLLMGGGVADVGDPHLRPKTRFTMCPTPSGSAANFQYLWTPALYLSLATAAEPRAYLRSTTTFHVETIDNKGCAHRDSNTVIVSYRRPELTPRDSSFCFGNIITFNSSGGLTYAWSTTDTAATFSCTNCSSPVVFPSRSGIYSVIISDQYNCADTLTSKLTVFPLPKVKASTTDSVVYYGGNTQLRVTGASTYIWAPSYNLDNPTGTSPMASYLLQPTSYVVYGFDTNNCTGIDTVNININYRKPIFVPSAFTPNGDGENDLFRVGGVTYEKVIEFRVFNRWGQEVFSTTGNNGWDGTWNGVVQDIGAYFYLIRVVYPDGYMETFQGELTLIR